MPCVVGQGGDVGDPLDKQAESFGVDGPLPAGDAAGFAVQASPAGLSLAGFAVFDKWSVRALTAGSMSCHGKLLSHRQQGDKPAGFTP